MLFTDENIRLHIKDKQTLVTNPITSAKEYKDYSFKAYLEESKVQIKTLDTNIQYAPLNFTNNTQFLKTQYSVDFSFNVFAEDREEAAENYDKLHSLLNIVKPNYKFTNNQYLPMAGNIFGLIQIQFSGLPKLSKNDALDIYVTNFAYNINKDMGYLQMPYAPNNQTPDRSQLYVSGSNVLIPIAYRLDISGRVLLPLEESIRTQDKTNGVVKSKNKKTGTLDDIINNIIGNDSSAKDKFMQQLNGFLLASGVTQDQFANASQQIKQLLVRNLKKRSNILDEDGMPKEGITINDFNAYADQVSEFERLFRKN